MCEECQLQQIHEYFAVPGQAVFEMHVAWQSFSLIELTGEASNQVRQGKANNILFKTIHTLTSLFLQP